MNFVCKLTPVCQSFTFFFAAALGSKEEKCTACTRPVRSTRQQHSDPHKKLLSKQNSNKATSKEKKRDWLFNTSLTNFASTAFNYGQKSPLFRKGLLCCHTAVLHVHGVFKFSYPQHGCVLSCLPLAPGFRSLNGNFLPKKLPGYKSYQLVVAVDNSFKRQA